jgi:YegS/Rv2252/BmrU family lipid kinase
MHQKRKIAVILNPAAKGEKAGRLIEEVRETTDTELFKLTEAAGDAELMARDFIKEGADTIIAAGGDGTINEVVNGMVESDVPLGILPIGTANVLAKELGIPPDWRKAWEVIRNGHTRRIDLGRAEEHYFVQMAGVGFDAQVIKQTGWEFKKNWGPLSYVWTGMGLLAEKSPRLIVQSEELEEDEITARFVLVGNGRYYGGPFEVFPAAKMDDGYLNVYIFQKLNYGDVFRYLQGIFAGNMDGTDDLVVRKLKQFTVRAQDEREVPAEVDGELLGEVPVTFRVQPKALEVLVPEQLTPSFVDYGEGKKQREESGSNLAETAS